MKIALSTGGTAGHVLPAEEIARELIKRGDEVVFIGGLLEKNRYFHREEFSYYSIASARGFKALFHIAKGVCQSLLFFFKNRPSVVIGFGSFYAVPPLMAAKILRIPILLFEPNAIPGRVNRFFSRWAKASAVQFLSVAERMKGACHQIKVKEGRRFPKEEAALYYGLSPKVPTVLVFGGSQGAEAINFGFLKALQQFAKTGSQIQVVHLIGAKEAQSEKEIVECYRSLNIPCAVKLFEAKMSYAWSLADLVIARSGALTVAEVFAFQVPAILIPLPTAADDHQTKNARFVVERVLGGVLCREEEIGNLSSLMIKLMNGRELEEKKEALKKFSESLDQKTFIQFIDQALLEV